MCSLLDWLNAAADLAATSIRLLGLRLFRAKGAATWDYTSCNLLCTVFVEQRYLCQYQVLTGSREALPQELFGQIVSNRKAGLSNQALGRQTEALQLSWTALSPISCCSPLRWQLITKTDFRGLEPCRESIHVWESPGSRSDNMNHRLWDTEISLWPTSPWEKQNSAISSASVSVIRMSGRRGGQLTLPTEVRRFTGSVRGC